MSSFSRASASSRSRVSSSVKNAFHPLRMSSEETRNPRSIKKLKVVCQAGPKSSSVPRPRPSRFHKNSFNPFETRVDSGESDARVPPTPEIGKPDVHEREFECAGNETPRLEPL